MRTLPSSALRCLLVLTMSGLLLPCAWAQWQWTDNQGRTVLSDRPPPADIPDAQIAKRPTGVANKSTVAPTPTTTPGTALTPPASPASAARNSPEKMGEKSSKDKATEKATEKTADKASDKASDKAAADKAASEKSALDKAKEQEARAAAQRQAELERQARADNCARAQRNKLAYESGTRIARYNAAGEREFLDDAARASELQYTQNIIAKDCK